jgi:hypothetical protein
VARACAARLGDEGRARRRSRLRKAARVAQVVNRQAKPIDLRAYTATMRARFDAEGFHLLGNRAGGPEFGRRVGIL